MFYITAAMFIAVSVLHLAGCVKEDSRICTATKPVLMPLVALCVFAAFADFLFPPSLTADQQQVLVLTLLALAFGTAGDVFLMFSKSICLVIGGISFLTGHVLWIAQKAQAYTHISCIPVLIMCVMYIAYLIFMYLLMGKPHTMLIAEFGLYALFLGALSLTAAVNFIVNPAFPSLLFLAGALLFLTSDSMLCYSKVKSEFTLSHFWVMFTYIAAQTLLAAGCILPVLHS